MTLDDAKQRCLDLARELYPERSVRVEVHPGAGLSTRVGKGLRVPGAEGFWAEVVTPKHRGLGAGNEDAFAANADGFLHDEAFGTTEQFALDKLEELLLQRLGR